MRATQTAALELTRQGFVVIPKRGKKPALRGWKTAKHATPAEIAGWTAENIAIRTGRDSGNLIVLDCDGLTAYDAFRAALPDMVDTWTVASGSGRGMHVYFRTDILPDKKRAMKIAALDNNNLELMTEGDSVVAPPSIHPDTGRPYTVSIKARIKNLTGDDTQRLINFIGSHQSAAERSAALAPAPVIMTRTGNRQGQGRIDRERLKADAIARLTSTHHWKRSGQGIAGRVPWREDKKPSGMVFLKTGTFNDNATGEKLQLIELAQRIGLNPDDYRAPAPERRAGLGHPTKLPNTPRPQPAATVQPEPVDCLSDAVILEIANSFTAAAGMLARLMDDIRADLPDTWTPADLTAALNRAGYPMTRATVYRAIAVLTGVRIEFVSNNRTLKEENPPYDKLRQTGSQYQILPLPACLEALKAATMTRLIKSAYPESAIAPALPAITAKMLTDTLAPGEDTAAIVTALNQALPVPERGQERAHSVYMECVKKYRAILKTFSDESITRPDLTDNDRARSNPNAYLDVLRRERLRQFDQRQVSGRAIGATIGIHDPRQRNRKLKALGIIRHAVKLHEEIQDIAAIDRHARRNCAHPLRLIAVNRSGDETAAASIDTPHAAAFVTTQRSAGYRVYVELQAASRIEISTPPERETVSRKPEIVQNAANANSPARTAPNERAEEIPGRYTEHWLKFHILRRLTRHEHFYTNPATGEIIPRDLTGSLAELIEALTGYRLTQREEQTA